VLHFKSAVLREAKRCWLATKGFKNDRRGDDFGEELGGGVWVGAEEDVGGDSFSAIFLKGSGNGWIAAGPVGHEKCDISFTEGGFDFCTRKGESFVDLAGEAPSGGEIDKDGSASGELAGDLGFGPGEAIGGGCGEGGGGGSF
jgi:hypothetical protein